MAKYLDATGLAQVWAAAKGAFLTSSGGDGRYLRHYNDSSLDANSADPGWHDVINSITNAAHSNHSSLIYVSNVGTPFQLQIPDSTEDYIYKRSYTSSSWSSWRKMKAGYADSAGNASTAESATSASSALNLLPENTAHYFRDSSNASWRGGMFWGSAGSESMSFVAVNGSTRFQFVGGSDIASWTSNTWSSVTPYLTIYSSGIVTSGSATATGFVKSGSSDSYVLLGGGGHKAVSDFATSGHTHSYLPLSGGTLTGNGASLIIGQSAGSPGVSTARKLRLGLGTVGHTGSQYWAFCVDDTTSNSYLQIGYTESDKSISIRHDGYIAVGKVDPSYRVDISGSLNATTLYQNGTAVSVDGHTHSYLPLSGGTLTGALTLSYATSATMDNTTTNPRIIFSENGSQAVGLVYTDYDSYRPSKGLKVVDVDGSDAGNVWFEAQGNIYSAGFVHRSYNSASYLLLSNGGVKAVSDFVDSSSLGTAASKDSTTVVSSGNGALITSGAVYDYIETYIAPSRYETVTITCVTDESGVSMYGSTITIDGVDYTIPSDGIVSTQVTADTVYSIIPGKKDGYITPDAQTITAVNGRTRNLTLIWTKINYGVYIYYSDESVSVYNTLKSGRTASGVWLYNSKVSIIIHPSEGTNQTWWTGGSNSSFPGSSGSQNSSSAIKSDYNGVARTNSVVSTRYAGTAFTFVRGVDFLDGKGRVGYMAAGGEWEQIRLNLTNINTALGLIGGTQISTSKAYWTSNCYIRYWSYEGTSYTDYNVWQVTLSGNGSWDTADVHYTYTTEKASTRAITKYSLS